MIVDCISDMHGAIPELEGGDLLIVAGDLTGIDAAEEYLTYFQWLSEQRYERIVWIAGNHDGGLANDKVMREIKSSEFFPACQYAEKIEYLMDSGTEYKGLRIWGSPWTPTFQDWHFMKDRGSEIKAMWDKIPLDTNILITHGPPLGILDTVTGFYSTMGSHVGCEDLKNKINHLNDLKLHVFGHIHECHGIKKLQKTTFVNASMMNVDFDPENKPIRIELSGIQELDR